MCLSPEHLSVVVMLILQHHFHRTNSLRKAKSKTNWQETELSLSDTESNVPESSNVSEYYQSSQTDSDDTWDSSTNMDHSLDAKGQAEAAGATQDICTFYWTVVEGHGTHKGQLYCQMVKDPGAQTTHECLRDKEVLEGSQKKPSRMTAWRRRKREEKDKKVLQEGQAAAAANPGDPCHICSSPRTLQGGHPLYNGQFYCENIDGLGSKTARKWLEEQACLAALPRTTAFNFAKRCKKWETEPPAKKRKQHKVRICQLCGQPRQKPYGHSQHKSEHFCALYECKSVEMWLAERREKE